MGKIYTPQHPLPIAVLISGQGSNLQAIIDAIEAGLPAKITVVVSDNPAAYGLTRAHQANLPTATLTRTQFPDKNNYEQALIQCLASYQPELIILAGFMRILTEQFIQHFPNRILNIHPSLLPRHPGLHTHEKVLAAGDTQHGTTVHVVTADLDSGPIIAQAAFSIAADDTPASLKSKVQTLEHKLYPEVIKLYAQGHLQFFADHVELDHKRLPGNVHEITWAFECPDWVKISTF